MSRSIALLAQDVVAAAVAEVKAQGTAWVTVARFILAKPDAESLKALHVAADKRNVGATVTAYVNVARKLTTISLRNVTLGKLTYAKAQAKVRTSDDGESKRGRPVSKAGIAKAVTQVCKYARTGLLTDAQKARIRKALAN
jgi:hypothetical protein